MMFNLLGVMVCVLRWRKSCRLGMEVPRLSKMQVFRSLFRMHLQEDRASPSSESTESVCFGLCYIVSYFSYFISIYRLICYDLLTYSPGLPPAAPAYTAAIRTLGRKLFWNEALRRADLCTLRKHENLAVFLTCNEWESFSTITSRLGLRVAAADE